MQPDYNNYSTNPARQALIRLIVVAGVLLGAIVIIWITWSQVINKHTVTFKPSPGTAILIGTIKQTDDGEGIQTVLGQTPNQKSVHLKPGYYQVLYTGKDYEQQYKRVNVNADMILATPQGLWYNDSKLKSVLQQEKDTIHAAMAPSVDISTYTPQNERLLYDGTWYISQLIPANTTAYDPQLIIMRKQGGTWKVVAGPKIIFYKGDYPGIPEEVMRTINNIPVNITAPDVSQ